MHDQEHTRPPAPELSPTEMLRVIEFEFLPSAFEEQEA